MTIAFESQNMRGKTVEEEAVMADDDGATGEAFQRLFECRQCFDIEIVGRLIEQQHVATLFEHFRHMHAVAFAA